MKDYMKNAIKQALIALEKDEVPIGAIIVKDGKIVAKGYNNREQKQNACAHAEINAINKACKKLGSWRLDGAEMYVTLEPCPMCAGAISNARIAKVVYGCKEKTSQDNLCEKILSSERLNHKTEMVFDDTHEQEISTILSNFFKSKRNKKVQE